MALLIHRVYSMCMVREKSALIVLIVSVLAANTLCACPGAISAPNEPDRLGAQVAEVDHSHHHAHHDGHHPQASQPHESSSQQPSATGLSIACADLNCDGCALEVVKPDSGASHWLAASHWSQLTWTNSALLRVVNRLSPTSDPPHWTSTPNTRFDVALK